MLFLLSIYLVSIVLDPRFTTGFTGSINSPNPTGHQRQAAVDKTVVWIDGEKHWLYTAAGPDSNGLLHTKLEPTRTNALAVLFFGELKQNHDVDHSVFLVDDATPLEEVWRRHGLVFRDERHGDHNSAERIVRAVEKRTSCFSDCFSHVDPATADDWLNSFAFAWNQHI